MPESMIDVSEMLQESAQEYALDVILDRAIPDVRDGLKPIHRRIMWQLYLSKLFPDNKPDSAATVVGKTMKWHPHGDGSIESSLKNMSRDWVMSVPLVELIGQGGSFDADAAASRYLKVRMTNAARFMSGGLDKNAVDFEPNYDGTAEMPVVMPSAIPSALALGTKGIAWGMSTSILQHNVIELLKVARLIVDKPDASVDEIVKIMPGPDFPSGCTIYGDDPGRDEVATGEASYVIRGSIREIEHEGRRALEVYELPPDLGSTKFTQQAGNALSGVSSQLKIDRIDNATRESKPSILIVFDKGASDDNLEVARDVLYSKTQLESRVRAQNRMIHDGWARIMSVPEYMKAWLDFRRETLCRIRRFEYDGLTRDLELIDAALFIIDHPHEVTEVASEAPSLNSMVSTLQERFNLTERQSEYIAKQPLHRLSAKNTSWVEQQRTKRPQVADEIERIDKLLNSDELITQMLRDDIDFTIKSLGEDTYPRTTRIADKSELEKKKVQLEPTSLVESKPVRVVAYEGLILHRIGQKAFENQEPSHSRGLIDSVDAMTDEFVMGITRKGRIVTRLVNDLDHVNLGDTVEPMNRSVTTLDSDDEFVALVPVRDNVRAMMLTAHGYMKVADSTKLAPNTNTRYYVTRTVPASGLKSEGDEINHVIVFVDGDLVDGDVLSYELDKGTSRVKRDLSLSKWLSRHDSGTSSGAKAINTRDGEYNIGSCVIHRDGERVSLSV